MRLSPRFRVAPLVGKRRSGGVIRVVGACKESGRPYLESRPLLISRFVQSGEASASLYYLRRSNPPTRTSNTRLAGSGTMLTECVRLGLLASSHPATFGCMVGSP